MNLAIFLFLAFIFEVTHAWEEYHFSFGTARKRSELTGINLGKNFAHLSQDQAGLLIYKIMMAVMMLLLTLLVAGGVFKLIGLLILGLYFIFQLHHILDAIVGRKYNPGLVTSLLWLPVVVAWWLSFVKGLL